MRSFQTALVLLALVSLPACGERQRVPVTHVPRWNVSKPASAVGRVRVAVVERPAPDRAWVEAVWEAHDHAAHEMPTDCELRIALPEGAFVLEGEECVPLASALGGGSHRWLVSFPTGRPLDAVLRYCAVTPQGPRAAEVAVRLTPDRMTPDEDSGDGAPR